VTVGLTTWDEAGTLAGNVLVAINSEPEAAPVDLLFEALARCTKQSQLHVIASRGWQEWANARGIHGDHLLLALDDDGRDVELNHFLESHAALSWLAPKDIAFFVGSEPHSVYNDEVKDVLEQRAAVLLGDGLFLAHTLPSRYIFAFDVAALIERIPREAKVARYEQAVRGVIDELHRQWKAGAPGDADAPDFTAAVPVITARLPQLGVAAGDEDRAILPAATAALTRGLTPFVGHFRDVLLDRDRQLDAMRALLASTQAEVDKRDALLVELEAARRRDVEVRDREIVRVMDVRNEDVKIRDNEIVRISEERSRAVADRDGIIAGLRAELDRLSSGWRRLVNGRPRV